jgi:hypothetical protein
LGHWRRLDHGRRRLEDHLTLRIRLGPAVRRSGLQNLGACKSKRNHLTGLAGTLDRVATNREETEHRSTAKVED